MATKLPQLRGWSTRRTHSGTDPALVSCAVLLMLPLIPLLLCCCCCCCDEHSSSSSTSAEFFSDKIAQRSNRVDVGLRWLSLHLPRR